MKMKDENEMHILKTAIKNEYLFWRLCLNKTSILDQLTRIRIVYKPPEANFDPLIEKGLNPHTRLLLRDKIISIAWKIVDLIEEPKKTAFNKTVDELIEAFNLGKEWKDPLVAFVMTEVLCPPAYNLFIKREEGRSFVGPDGKVRYSRVGLRPVLVLNPDTSPKDIRSALPIIKKMQRSAWPKFKNFNITENSKRDLDEQIRLRIDKMKEVPDKEKYASFSEWEERLLKQGYPMKEVLKYRKKGGGGVSRKSIKIKRSITNEDFIKLTRPGLKKTQLDKEINKLKQKTSRMRKK